MDRDVGLDFTGEPGVGVRSVSSPCNDICEEIAESSCTDSHVCMGVVQNGGHDCKGRLRQSISYWYMYRESALVDESKFPFLSGTSIDVVAILLVGRYPPPYREVFSRHPVFLLVFQGGRQLGN